MKALILTVFLLAVILAVRLVLYYTQAEVIPEGKKVTIRTTLRSAPKPEGGVQRFSILTSRGKRIFIRTQRFPQYHYGQELEMTGKIKKVTLPDGSAFFQMDFPQITVVKEYSSPLLYLAGLIRHHVTSVFGDHLIYPYSAILIGIVYGIREGIPGHLIDAFSKTGVIHITAASGMNVTMVAGAIFMLTASFLHRKTAIIVSLVAIWLYAAIAGFDASITRASLMASIAFSASFLGRQHAGWYALCLTGFGMIFASPSILFDVGFQLSFASTAGILYLVPLLSIRKIGEQPTPMLWFLKDDIKTTIASQFASIPILLSQFGEYSPFAVVVNLLVLWTIPFLMVFGGIASIVSLIHPLLSVPFLYLCLPMLLYLEKTVLLSAEILPSIRFDSFPVSLVIAYYFFLFSTVLILRRRRS